MCRYVDVDIETGTNIDLDTNREKHVDMWNSECVSVPPTFCDILCLCIAGVPFFRNILPMYPLKLYCTTSPSRRDDCSLR